MKPKYNNRWIASIVVGTCAVTSSAFALDNLWTGNIDNDWSKNGNWSDPHTPPSGMPHVPNNGAGHPGDEDAVINTLTNFPVIVGNTSANPRDIKVGIVGSSFGRLDVRAGTAAAGGGNWILVGDGGGNGTLNVANTSSPTPGNFSGFAPGTGGTVSGQLRIGTGGGTGVANINTSGTLAHSNDLIVGDGNNSNGTFNMDSGTMTTGGWNFVGRGGGSQGFFNVSGGTLTNTGRFYLGENGTATAVQTGGSVLNNDEVRIGEGDSGVATYTISGGTFTANNWFLIGRNGSDGTLNLSGSGIITKGGSDPFAIGNDAVNGSGTFIQSGGTITTAAGSPMHIGNVAGGSPGIWNMSGGIATIGGQVRVGAQGIGTLTLTGGSITAQGNLIVAAQGGSSGTLALNAGTLTSGKISGGGGADVTSFNGTQIVVSLPSNPFIENLDAPTIDAGGLKIDTAGFNVTVPQVFTGSGGVTKSGGGTLTLSGASSNSGANTVLAGKLAFTTDSVSGGNISVASGASLGVVQSLVDPTLSRTNVSFGASNSKLDIDLGNLTPNTTVAPLNVTGTLTLGGNVTITVSDQLPEVGSIPLVSYVGPKAGPGVFVLGPLPNGVQATLSDVGGVVSLNVTSVALPYWDATVNGIWDTTTQNWINFVSGLPTNFNNGDPALFNDFVTGISQGAVVLNQTVTPAGVTFDNASVPYSLTGTGKISGATGLVKQNLGTLTLDTANDYTGITTLTGGITSVTVLANGGSASSIGASSSSPGNLLLNGGVLNYIGASAITDRGLTIAAANTGISTQNDLELSGGITSTGGELIKSGPGNLTLSNPGTKTIGVPNQVSEVVQGTLTLAGAGTTSIPGELWVGSQPNLAGNLVVNGGTLNVGSWIALGRGNGDSGTISTLTATNSTVQCVNFATGFDNGLPNNCDQTVTLTNTNWTNGGRTNLGESANAVTNMTIGGSSTYVANDRFLMALGLDSEVNVTIKDSGTLNKTGGWLSIGNSSNGKGKMTVQDSGTLSATGDFNVADVDTSQGTLDILNSAVVNSTGTFFLGKNANTIGTVNLNGGTLNVIRVRGGGGAGNLNFNGGVLRALPGADGNFIDQVTNITVLAGGGTIDSNGLNIDTAQTFGGVGGLTKAGAGNLSLNGFISYTGTTTISGGTLRGNGTLARPVAVGALGNINPGNISGTLTVGSTTFAPGGTLTIDISGQADTLKASGNLDLTAGKLVINGTPTLPVYVIAEYNTRTGTFTGGVPVLPPNYVIDYNYNGATQIAITRPLTPFETWAQTFFPGDTDPAIIGSEADPDGDGSSNSLEFALGGTPNSGADGPKVYHLLADSSDGDTLKELLLTIAVRNGTPVFAGSPSPTATMDGFQYTIQGSFDLASYNSPVSVVSPVTTGLPAAPAEYEYRTFSLDGTNGFPGRGFLRAKVNP